MMRWGRGSASLNSGEPQLAQNERRIGRAAVGGRGEDARLADNLDRVLVEDRVGHAGAAAEILAVAAPAIAGADRRLGGDLC